MNGSLADAPAYRGDLTVIETTAVPRRGQLLNICPLRDRVLAKRLAAQDKTPGGLFIPDTARAKPPEALVVSMGDGKGLKGGEIQPLSVKAGDRLLISKYARSEMKLDGTDSHAAMEGKPEDET
jgi:chaperonin GroES